VNKKLMPRCKYQSAVFLDDPHPQYVDVVRLPRSPPVCLANEVKYRVDTE
jgi:hypothetical protein